MRLNICLDVGGTFIKGMVFDNQNEEQLEGISYYEAKSNLSRERIIENFVVIIEDLYDQVPEEEKILESITLAFPGPFDYEKGISFIQSLNKYDSLYGINIKDAINNQLMNSRILVTNPLTVQMFNDAVAFAYGEYSFHQPENSRGAYITLGTGCGSTFIEKGKLVKNKYEIPKSGMIYNEPFKKSIIDNYLSARGLEKIIQEVYGEYVSPEDVALNASYNQDDAITVYYNFGRNIGEALNNYLLAFQPSEIVFGGQISKSFHLMEKGFRDGLDLKLNSLNCRCSINTSFITIRGLNSLQKKEGVFLEQQI